MRGASRAIAAIAACAVLGACSATPGGTANRAANLALPESELPQGVRNVMRAPDYAWGRTTVLGGSEPCFTATRNHERARDGLGLSSTSAVLGPFALRFEVTAATISATAVLSRFACTAEGGETARATWLPDDLLRRPATVIEVRTPSGRLAAMEGFLDAKGVSVAVSIQNFGLVTGAADAAPEDVDRDQFWRLFRAQIDRVDRSY